LLLCFIRRWTALIERWTASNAQIAPFDGCLCKRLTALKYMYVWLLGLFHPGHRPIWARPGATRESFQRPGVAERQVMLSYKRSFFLSFKICVQMVDFGSDH
jgi:hypothetical protein